MKSYNYGVPSPKRSRPFSHSGQHQQHASLLASSFHQSHDLISYDKPAEIYVYARKRPLLSAVANFRDTINVTDPQHMNIAENKANLDGTSFIKQVLLPSPPSHSPIEIDDALLCLQTEFQFDQVFSAQVSNKHVFESTVLPFLSTDHRLNLTYICFGQTGSGLSSSRHC